MRRRCHGTAVPGQVIWGTLRIDAPPGWCRSRAPGGGHWGWYVVIGRGLPQGAGSGRRGAALRRSGIPGRGRDRPAVPGAGRGGRWGRRRQPARHGEPPVGGHTPACPARTGRVSPVRDRPPADPRPPALRRFGAAPAQRCGIPAGDAAHLPRTGHASCADDPADGDAVAPVRGRADAFRPGLPRPGPAAGRPDPAFSRRDLRAAGTHEPTPAGPARSVLALRPQRPASG